jgi:Rho-binding antiterminator
MYQDYKPISCDFYDELEALATRHKTCDIIFFNNGGRSQIRGEIADLYTREKVEYLKTTSGLEIRLDQLVEVDGKIASNYC